MNRTRSIVIPTALMLVAGAISCGPKPDAFPCKFPAADQQLIDWLKDSASPKQKKQGPSGQAGQSGSGRVDRRFIRKIADRLTASSQNRARDVCKAIDGPPKEQETLYDAKIVSLLDREQQLLEIETAIARLRDKAAKADSKSLCADLWKEVANEPEVRDDGLLEDCDKAINQRRSDLSSRLTSFFQEDPTGKILRKGLAEAGKDLSLLKDATIGQVAERCDRERPGCAGLFSLAKFLRQTDKGKIRFDYERAVVHGMVVGARRAEQQFDALVSSLGIGGYAMDTLGRPLFQGVVAALEVHITQFIQNQMSEQISQGGLLHAACNVYEKFELSASPNAAERTVRGIVLRFHEEAKEKGQKPPPVCVPEWAIFEHDPSARRIVRSNIRRMMPRTVAKSMKKEIDAEYTGTIRQWEKYAMLPVPIDLKEEVAKFRDADGNLTPSRKDVPPGQPEEYSAVDRRDNMATCIVASSPLCAHEGDIDAFSSCVASSCGSQYYRYFVDSTAEQDAAQEGDACCDDDRGATMSVLSEPLEQEIKDLEAEMISFRVNLLNALVAAKYIKLSDSSSTVEQICLDPAKRQRIKLEWYDKDRQKGAALGSLEALCDAELPFSLISHSLDGLRSCNVKTREGGSTTLWQSGVDTLKGLREPLKGYKIKVVGFSDTFDAKGCREEWEEAQKNGKKEDFDWEPPVNMEGACPGAAANRALRLQRAEVFRDAVFGPSDPDVTVEESLTRKFGPKEVCSAIGIPSDRVSKIVGSADCDENKVTRCIDVPGAKSHRKVETEAGVDRRVEIHIEHQDEAKLRRLQEAKADLQALKPAASCGP